MSACCGGGGVPESAEKQVKWVWSPILHDHPPPRLSPSDLIIRFHLYWQYQPSGSEVCLVHAAVLPNENLIFRGVESNKA